MLNILREIPRGIYTHEILLLGPQSEVNDILFNLGKEYTEFLIVYSSVDKNNKVYQEIGSAEYLAIARLRK